MISKVFDLTFGRFLRASTRSVKALFPSSNLFDVMSQLALLDSAKFALENFGVAVQFKKRDEFFEYCIEKMKANHFNRNVNSPNDDLILEFGVWTGASINFFAELCPSAQIVGFDSFMGLQEDWGGTSLKAGHFNLDGQLPLCKTNVRLVKGWFQESLPKYKFELKSKQISLLHLDADTYSPTSFVLNQLAKNIKKGSIIILDDYMGYAGWQFHVFKAFQEFVKYRKLKFHYIAYTNRAVALAIL